jgi:hypothetical protein
MVGMLALAGCETDRGGTEDPYYSGSSTGVKPAPTMRPGMDPQDIRDPNYLNRPQSPSGTGTTP